MLSTNENLCKLFAKLLQVRYRWACWKSCNCFWNYFKQANRLILLGAQASQKNDSFRSTSKPKRMMAIQVSQESFEDVQFRRF